MTIPTKMNCAHSGEGWCLTCVTKIAEALEFYANERNWKTTSVFMCGHSSGARVEIDQGKKARIALYGEETENEHK